MSGKLIDLTGRQYTELTVIGRHASNGPRGEALWDVICSCGEERIVYGANLRKGYSKSCGHLRREWGHQLHALSQAARKTSK